MFLAYHVNLVYMILSLNVFILQLMAYERFNLHVPLETGCATPAVVMSQQEIHRNVKG
jgi:hydrogenase-4 membrane subunit HyfE